MRAGDQCGQGGQRPDAQIEHGGHEPELADQHEPTEYRNDDGQDKQAWLFAAEEDGLVLTLARHLKPLRFGSRLRCSTAMLSRP